MRRGLKYFALSFVALLILSCGVIFLSHDFSAQNSVQKNDIGEIEQQDDKIGESDAWFTPMPSCYDSANIYAYREPTSQTDEMGGSFFAGWLCMWHDHKGGLQYNDYFKIILYPGYYIKSFKFYVTFNGGHNFTVTQSGPDANPSISWSTLYAYKVSLDRSAGTLGGWTYTIQLDGHSSSTYIEKSNTGIDQESYELTLGSGIDGRIFSINLDKDGGNSGTSTIYEKYHNGFYSDSSASTSISSITPPTKSGYTFGGYYASKNGEGTKYINANGSFASDLNIMSFSSNVTLYASWRIEDYDIILKDYGSIYQYGTNFYLDTLHKKKMTPSTNPISPIPTQKGYIFQGYFTSSSSGTQYIDAYGYILTNVSAFSSDSYLYPHWTPITYTLSSYDLNRGSASTVPEFGTSHPTGSYNFTDEITISDPTMSGYTFKGWTFDGDTDTAQYFVRRKKHGIIIHWYTDVWGSWGSQTIPQKATQGRYKQLASTQGAQVHLTAQWQANNYDVVFNSNKPENMSSSITQIIAGDSYTSTSKTMSGFVSFDGYVDENHTARAEAVGWTFDGYWTAASGGTKIFNADGSIVKGVSGYTNSAGRWLPQSGATVYAHWTPANQTITFNSNKPSNMSGTITQILNGSNYTNASQAMSVTFDSVVSKTAKATATGWTFKGYYTASSDGDQVFDASGNIVASVATLTSDTSTWIKAGATTLYAQWEANKYNINTTLNGGSLTGSTSFSNLVYDSSVQYIPNPTKTGYTFAGWTFNGNTSTAKYGNATTNATTLWNNASTKVKATYFKNLTPTNGATVTLTANWTANTYSISYNLNGGSYGTNHPTSATFDTAFTVNNPTRANYTFTGWNITGMDSVTHTYGSNTSTETSLSGVTATSFKNLRSTSGTVTFTATWDANVYEIALNNQSATNAGTARIYEKYGIGYYLTGNTTTRVVQTQITTNSGITVPTKTGYTFGGYYTQTNGNGTQILTAEGKLVPSLSTSLFTSGSTLYAKWTINSYTITLKKALSDGTNTTYVDYKEITQNYATAISAEPNPTQTGYSFTGWSETIPSTMPAQNKTIYANFTINQYTLTFTVLQGNPQERTYTLTQNYGTDVVSPDQNSDGTANAEFNAYLNDRGYWFESWGEAVPDTMPAENKDYYATLLEDALPITYTIPRGATVNGVNPQAYTATTPTFTLINPERRGYTFIGWSGTDIGNGTTDLSTTVTIQQGSAGARAYTANFQINQYTLSIFKNQDDDPSDHFYQVTQNYGTTIGDITQPTKKGYTFRNWSEKIPTIMPDEDKIIYANWDINQYTFTFVDGVTNEIIDTITQDYNTTLTVANPDKLGYTFTGWSQTIPAKMPNQDRTITANFSINEYTLTFIFNDDVYAEIEQDYDTAVVAPEIPEIAGYIFLGWDNEVPERMPAQDMTINANVEVISYDITYYLPSEEIVNNNPTEYTVESDDIELEELTWLGYDFEGWTYETQNEPTKEVLIASGSTEDKVFTACFDPIIYTILKHVDGQDSEETYTIESETYTIENPVKLGYEFLGWSGTGIDGLSTEVTIENGSIGNVELTANFEIITYTISYQLNDGVIDGENPVQFNINSEDILIINPTKTGFTFMGWTWQDHYEPVLELAIPQGSTENRAYTANFQINEYTIRFVDGDNLIVEVTQNYGSPVMMPADPEKEGYTFTGWSEDIPDHVGAENVTIHANFTPIVYSIYYIIDEDVKVDGQNPSQYTIESDDITLINPTREGYIFNGWYEYEGDKPITDYTIEKGSTGDKTLTASWTKIDSNKTPIIVGASIGGAVLIAGAVGIGLAIAKRKKRIV